MKLSWKHIPEIWIKQNSINNKSEVWIQLWHFRILCRVANHTSIYRLPNYYYCVLRILSYLPFYRLPNFHHFSDRSTDTLFWEVSPLQLKQNVKEYRYWINRYCVSENLCRNELRSLIRYLPGYEPTSTCILTYVCESENGPDKAYSFRFHTYNWCKTSPNTKRKKRQT